MSIDFDDPLEPQVLLPAIVPRRRPRFESYHLWRGQPHLMALTMHQDWIERVAVNLAPAENPPPLDVQAKVFRRWNDPSSLISHKTVENQGIHLCSPTQGQFEIQLTKEDLAETRTIYIAIYVEGNLVDLIGNEVQDSPRPL